MDITDFTIPTTPLGDIKINGVMKIKSREQQKNQFC
jgi:hypothetical protein